jgi:hypothetical protein
MKKCFPSLAIKELQIKTTLRFHLTAVRMTVIKSSTTQEYLQSATQVITKASAHLCLLQPYLQQPSIGNSQYAPPLMNGTRKYGIYI